MSIAIRRSPMVIATLSVSMGLGLTGCAAESGDASGGGTIAFSSVSQQVPVVTELGNHVTDYMKTQDVKVITQDADFDPTKQSQQLTTSINNGQIDAAWIFPAAPEGLAPTVKLAQSKEVPVVVESDSESVGFDGPQPGVIFVAADFTKYGETIAQEAADCIAATGGTAQVAFLQAPGVAGGAKAVKESITSTFASAASGSKIVAEAEAADPGAAQTAVTQLLTAHPDITAVIAASDETALGAAAAFAAAGKTPDCLIAGGGGPDALQAQEDGKITSIVAWDYGAEVKEVGANLIELIEDPTAEGGVFSTPITVIE